MLMTATDDLPNGVRALDDPRRYVSLELGDLGSPLIDRRLARAQAFNGARDLRVGEARNRREKISSAARVLGWDLRQSASVLGDACAVAHVAAHKAHQDPVKRLRCVHIGCLLHMR